MYCFHNYNIIYKNKIKTYFKDKEICAVQTSSINKFLKTNEDINLYLKNILEQIPQYEKVLYTPDPAPGIMFTQRWRICLQGSDYQRCARPLF